MRFILPTQFAPTKPYHLDSITISPNHRVKIENDGMSMFLDSMIVESESADIQTFNTWMVFHAFVFGDAFSLTWYESPHASVEDKLPIEGECSDPVDYTNIANKVFFLDQCDQLLDYATLYNTYLQSGADDKNLMKSYLNIFTGIKISTNRAIRNYSFAKIMNSFSIFEAIIGDIPKCTDGLHCPTHGEIQLRHNSIGAKEWIKEQLRLIIGNDERVDEYLAVTWEVRQKLRHQAVHTAATSQATHQIQAERDVTYNWIKTQQEWISNSTALLDLTLRMNSIVKYLLMNRVFRVNFFPPLRDLQSTHISSN